MTLVTSKTVTIARLQVAVEIAAGASSTLEVSLTGWSLIFLTPIIILFKLISIQNVHHPW